MGYTIDHLSALMSVIVTTVAFLVMIYTDGYMAHDPGFASDRIGEQSPVFLWFFSNL